MFIKTQNISWAVPLFAVICSLCAMTMGRGTGHEQTNTRCGISAVSAEKHPWAVAIFTQRKDEFNQICCGVLLAPSFVLTADYCVREFKSKSIHPASRYKLGLGIQHRTLKHTDDIHGQYIDVAKIHSNGADIAILELKSPAILNDFVTPACLDVKNIYQLNSSSKGVVPGWGFDTVTHEVVPLIRATEVTYVSHEECLKVKETNLKEEMLKDKFCTIYGEGKEDHLGAGYGGSGILFEFDHHYYVYGITSFGKDNHLTAFADIRVPVNMEFIINTIGTYPVPQSDDLKLIELRL